MEWTHILLRLGLTFIVLGFAGILVSFIWG